jgi:hypothetical protein
MRRTYWLAWSGHAIPQMQGEHMTKTEMTTLLRSVGVNENTITAMENAYELGVEMGVEQGIKQERALWELAQDSYEADSKDVKA